MKKQIEKEQKEEPILFESFDKEKSVAITTMGQKLVRELQSAIQGETIEEVAANLADPNLCKTDNWIAGAKWQQEQMEKLKDFEYWKEWVNEKS
jgi:hypothetical protein